MEAKVQDSFTDTSLTSEESGIIRTLLYFDIFNYPLTEEEILKFNPVLISSKREMIENLSRLTNRKLIFKIDQFYSVRSEEWLAERRVLGNEMAKKMIGIARKYANLIAMFPYVRAIMLSGSISKNYMDADSDIDYFIVTQPGRLWITRALLALFRRLFLLNSNKFFCTNYLVDTETLEIEEKNIYTAFETATLIPVYGEHLWKKFQARNNWVKNHFPNLLSYQTEFIHERSHSTKKIMETFFFGWIGEAVDSFFMRVAIARWKKQFSKLFPQADFSIAFKSKRNVSKSHPRFFQKQILEQLPKKIEAFEVHHHLKISA
jgi:predicted nucleotidyltransferase